MTDLCETVSAASHGAALLAAAPALGVLLRRGPREARVPLMAYGLGLLACFGASTACHAIAAAGHDSRAMAAVDHMAIFLLIAGTYTPIVAALLPPCHRVATLRVVWLAAGVGVALNLRHGPLPPRVATAFYLAMGWGGLWCYAGMRPTMAHRRLAPMPLGGLFYSAGALIHVARWPDLWPGVFGSHELFHVFVIAGAAAHYAFILVNVATRTPERPAPAPAASLGPRRPNFLVHRGGARARANRSRA